MNTSKILHADIISDKKCLCQLFQTKNIYNRSMGNAFAKNLRELRGERGWSQSELAEKLGTTQRRVSYWENGKIEPDLSALIALADLFELTIDELIGRE